ncbi:MAG: RagB/SusD family nutrient uptake outer membrane protein [Rikenellaceae bacterium]|nr:RagB/SusD family nutrient uptake outer membrane protein [Rikenellaceae bacterium]
MKRFIYTLLLVWSATFMVGCSDLMETSPSGEVDKDMILANVESVETAMNGVYSTMFHRIDFVTANAHQCFGDMAIRLHAEVMGDDMVQTAEGAGWFWKSYCYEVRERFAQKIQLCYFAWKYYYEIISNVNYIISVENTAKGDAAKLKDLMAQAYTARAYAYFMLIQLYQQTYIGNEHKPGVPIYTTPTGGTSAGKGRGKVADVYKQINKDLTRAISLFEEAGLAQSHISHFDIYAAWLVRARVALVQNDWELAASSAEKAMAKPGRRILSRNEAEVTKGTFNDDTKAWTTGTTPFNSVSSPCVLWGAEVLSEQSHVYASFYSMMDACTDVYYAAESPKCISNWLYSQIPESDIRKGWWNGDIGVPTKDWVYGANINYNQHKFQWANQKANTGDFIAMRMEEACLIRAEALCRNKQYEDARIEIAKLGSARDSGYASRLAAFTDSDEQTFGTYGTVTTLLDEILLQRRIELWGEAGRLFDIQRQRKGWTRAWNVNGLQSNHTNQLSKYSDYAAFPSNYIECILMIPQTEIDNNPNMTDSDQNEYIQ